jgi:hypothetical protein
MLRIDARRLHAEMVEGHPRWDGATFKLISDSMRPLLDPFAFDLPIEEPVTVRVKCAGPYPTATSLLDLGGIAFMFVSGLRSSCHIHNYTTVYTEFIGAQLIRHLQERAA